MENNQTTYQPKTKNWWKIATISLIVLAVVLVGTTTLFAVQSGDRQNKLDEVKKQTSQGQEETSESEGNTSEGCEKTASSESEADNRRYLTIKEWGVKFEMPEDFSDLTYNIRKSDNNQAEAVSISGRFHEISAASNEIADYTDYFGEILRTSQSNNDYENCQWGCPTKIGINGEYKYYYGINQNTAPEGFNYQNTISRYLFAKMVSKVESI